MIYYEDVCDTQIPHLFGVLNLLCVLFFVLKHCLVQLNLVKLNHRYV